MSTLLKKITGTLLENKNTRQTLVKNVVWLSMGQVVSRLVRAAFIIYAARILGATEYGVFSYALGLAGFFTVFADIGINSILTREATQKPDERSAIFATTFWIKATLLAATALIVIFVTPLFSKLEAAKILIPLIAFLTILDGLRDFANSFFRALEKMELEAIVTVVTNVAISAAGFIILAYFANAFSLTLSYVVSAGVGTIVAIYILRNEFRQIIIQFNRRLVRPIMVSALPIALYGLFGAFMLNIDIIMLGIWRTSEDIGYYAAGQRILQVLYTIPGIFASAIFPTIARFIGEKKEREAALATEQSMTLTLALAIPIAVGGTILASSIITFLYGSTYAPAALPFSILAVTAIFTFAGAPLSNIVVAYDAQRKFGMPLIGGSIMNVLFDILLIPPYGMVGSAIATIISQLFTIGSVWIIVRKINRFKIFVHIWRVIIAAILLGIVAFVMDRFLHTHVISTIIISGLIYLATLYVLKEPLIHREARRFFASIRSS